MTLKRLIIVSVALSALAAGGAFAAGNLSNSLSRMDGNHDGKVSPEEFSADKPALFKKIDADRDGFVTHDEVAAYYLKKSGADDGRMDKRIASVMKADANADGKVSLDELLAATDADFRKRDKDGDGFITGAD